MLWSLNKRNNDKKKGGECCQHFSSLKRVHQQRQLEHIDISNPRTHGTNKRKKQWLLMDNPRTRFQLPQKLLGQQQYSFLQDTSAINEKLASHGTTYNIPTFALLYSNPYKWCPPGHNSTVSSTPFRFSYQGLDFDLYPWFGCCSCSIYGCFLA